MLFFFLLCNYIHVEWTLVIQRLMRTSQTLHMRWGAWGCAWPHTLQPWKAPGAFRVLSPALALWVTITVTTVLRERWPVKPAVGLACTPLCACSGREAFNVPYGAENPIIYSKTAQCIYSMQSTLFLLSNLYSLQKEDETISYFMVQFAFTARNKWNWTSLLLPWR